MHIRRTLHETPAFEVRRNPFPRYLRPQDVREFLKTEAVKQFDKNYDVLYALVKDKKINGPTFRDILVAYSSEADVQDIEKNVPLLNILVPKIALFDIDPANMDCTDPEIPVAVSKEKTTSLYLNGECAADLEKGEIPDFTLL